MWAQAISPEVSAGTRNFWPITDPINPNGTSALQPFQMPLSAISAKSATLVLPSLVQHAWITWITYPSNTHCHLLSTYCVPGIVLGPF